METLTAAPETRNADLWQQAKSRARFKAQLLAYVVVNVFIWTFWVLAPQRHSMVPWPVFVTAFWGFGLLMRGLAAYSGFNYRQRTQREYERLLRKQEGLR